MLGALLDILPSNSATDVDFGALGDASGTRLGRGIFSSNNDDNNNNNNDDNSGPNPTVIIASIVAVLKVLGVAVTGIAALGAEQEMDVDAAYADVI